MDKETKSEFEKVGKEFENLARVVKGEFDNVHKEIQGLREEMHEQFRQLRLEIKQIWNKLEEIEQKLERISRTSKEDVDAIASDTLNLKHRVEFLEKRVQELQKTS